MELGQQFYLKALQPLEAAKAVLYKGEVVQIRIDMSGPSEIGEIDIISWDTDEPERVLSKHPDVLAFVTSICYHMVEFVEKNKEHCGKEFKVQIHGSDSVRIYIDQRRDFCSEITPDLSVWSALSLRSPASQDQESAAYAERCLGFLGSFS